MVLSPPPEEGDAALFGEFPEEGEARDLKDDVILTGSCFLAGDLFIESARFNGESCLFTLSTFFEGDPKSFSVEAMPCDSCFTGEPALR
jgi:hypothetical protein